MKNRWMGMAGMALLGALSLQGCAHGPTERGLEGKLAQEPAVPSGEALNTEASQRIATAPGLTAEQRAKLQALQQSTRARAAELREQSLKLRSVLIEDLLASDYNAEEVNLVKKRMRDVDSQRLTVVFNAVEQANEILGRGTDPSRRDRLLRLFVEDRRGD